METIDDGHGEVLNAPPRIEPQHARGSHGVPHPIRLNAAAPVTTIVGKPGAGTLSTAQRVIHHWAQGPQDVTRTKAKRHKLRDGSKVTTRFEFAWFLDRVEGVKRTAALRAIYDVLLHPKTFMRAGVHWRRVGNPARADLIVRIIPSDNTYCGAGAAGCYSWGYEDGKPIVEIGVEYVGSPEFAMLLNHELGGHATFRCHDMYPIPGVPGHDDYDGVMGTWDAAERSGYYPPTHEIGWAAAWLDGRAAHVHQH